MDVFAKLWTDFTAEHPYDTVVRMNDDGTGGIWITQYTTLPSALSLELGEMLYQLRAALDGCVYDAAILEHNLDPPPKEETIAFPICRNAEAFKRASRKASPLSKPLLSIIESLQPYNAPSIDPDFLVFSFNRSLGILNDWARKDRHRRLHVIGSWVSGANPQVEVPEGTNLAYTMVANDSFLEHECEIACFKIAGWAPHLQLAANPDIYIDVAVDEFPPPCSSNDTLGNRLRAMMIAVKVIVRQFESECGLGLEQA